MVQLLQFLSKAEVLRYLLFPLFLGALSWWVLNFVVGPWLEFKKLRKEIHESLVFYANQHPPGRKVAIDEWGRERQERWREACVEIRRLSCKLAALYDSFYWWHFAWANGRKYRIKDASDCLMALNNSNDEEFATIFDDEARRDLKMRTSLKLETVNKIRKEVGLSELAG